MIHIGNFKFKFILLIKNILNIFGNKQFQQTLLMMKGATDLFMADTANFSRMFKSNESLSIDEVMHKTFIEVTETGTEAAAATLVFLTRKTPKKVFHATQPFIFFIRDERTGAILFSGRLVRPTPAETKQN